VTPLELDVLTLFPSWFSWLTEQRHVQNALAGPLALRLHNVRDHSPLKHRLVDDAPYGGGAGMVLRVDVVVAALEGALGAPLDELRAGRRIVALDPGGRPFDDRCARELAAAGRVVLLCGRYEGFDHRVLEHVATESLSIGPYVLSGGEVAAMVVIDAVARQLPGALGDDESAAHESFSPALEGRLEHPHYTRPEEFRGWRVPEVLLSGDHGRIAAWRRERSVARSEAGGRPRGLRYDAEP
jgi:tRNA (guanine37-N1)-methyltransferase